MNFRKPKSTNFSIELAPLIDMVFILLIFFMLSTALIKPVLTIDLPQTGTNDPIQTTTPFTLTLTAENQLFLDAIHVDMTQLKKELAQRVKSAPKTISVLIRADNKAHVGLFIELIDILKSAQITDIAIEHDISTPTLSN